MAILRKLRKIGNSTVGSIPKSILETLRADEGDNLEFIVDGDSVVIRKQEGSQKEIQALSNEMFANYDKKMRNLIER